MLGSTHNVCICVLVSSLSAHVTAAPPEILGFGPIMYDIWVSLVRRSRSCVLLPVFLGLYLVPSSLD